MEQNAKTQAGNKKTTRVATICAIVLVLLIVAVVALLLQNKPVAGSETGVKTITVEVVNADGTSKSFTIETEAEFLRGALEQENLIAGDTSELGMMITTVNGVQANDAKQEWWCVTKGGEMLLTGVDTTPIADADTFEITLTVGW